jgi:hypothetical protein
MKLCVKHMNELHAMIQRKGMGNLVIQSSQEADIFAQRWMKGQANIDNGEICPLVVSCLEIYQKTFNILGERANNPACCALCEMQKHTNLEVIADEWIDNVTDAVLATVTYHGISTSGIIIPH